MIPRAAGDAHLADNAPASVAATLVGCRALLFSLFLLRYARYPLGELPAGWTRARLSAAYAAGVRVRVRRPGRAAVADGSSE